MPNLPAPDLQPEFYESVALKRALAWVIDTVLVLLLTLLAVVLSAFVGALFFPFLYGAVNIAYRTVGLARWSATPGMMLLSIEFRDSSGHRLDPGTALAHTLIFTVAILIFPLHLLSMALILISERGQSLGDHILGTVALNRPAMH